MAAEIKGMAHVGVDAVDTKACAAWFVKHFGFKVLFSEPFGEGTTIELISNGSCTIEIVPAPEGSKPHGQVNHFAMEVENVDETVKYLNSIGIEIEGGQPLVLEGFFGRGVKAAFFEGPEGMRLEVCQYLS